MNQFEVFPSSHHMQAVLGAKRLFVLPVQKPLIKGASLSEHGIRPASRLLSDMLHPTPLKSLGCIHGCDLVLQLTCLLLPLVM